MPGLLTKKWKCKQRVWVTRTERTKHDKIKLMTYTQYMQQTWREEEEKNKKKCVWTTQQSIVSQTSPFHSLTSSFVIIPINTTLPSTVIYSPHVFRLIPCHIHFSSLPFVLESHTSLVKIRTTLRSIHSTLMLSFHLPLGLQSGLKETGHLEDTNKYYRSVNNTTFILYAMVYIYIYYIYMCVCVSGRHVST